MVIPDPAVDFIKGHGTGNDFIVIPDVDDRTDLSPDQVRQLCDRHRGLGADGVIRVVGEASEEQFFMDYRNADGSVAEMCGNGARVFVRALLHWGLWQGQVIRFRTRGGAVSATVNADGTISVDMGLVTEVREAALVRVGEQSWSARGLRVPNPHVVAFVEHLGAAGELVEAPIVEAGSAFPEGVNVEFVVPLGARHVGMRVHERGVGETLSCGTGACAVAWVAARHLGDSEPDVEWRVDVPGGTLFVTERSDGHMVLRGPAVIIAEGRVHLG